MDELEIRFRCLELAVKTHAAENGINVVYLAETFYAFANAKGSDSQGVEDDEIPF